MRQIVKCNLCDWIDYKDELHPDEEGNQECICPSCDKEDGLIDVDYGCTFTNRQIEKLWELLTDVPFNEDSDGTLVLAEEWFGFEKGTDREKIWHWFDENYSDGVAALMYGKEK